MVTQDKLLVLGLGNDILTDDAVGLNVVRQLAKEFAADPRIDVCETMEMGLALLDFLVGYRTVLLVDSIQTGRDRPGTVREVDVTGLKCLGPRTPHFVGVGETLAMGRQLGLPMPASVRVCAIEVEDPFTLGVAMTPNLQAAFPAILDRIRVQVEELAAQSRPDADGVWAPPGSVRMAEPVAATH